MAHENLPPTDDKYLLALSALICRQYEDIKNRLDEQNLNLKERIEEVQERIKESDAHFDRRIDKLEDNLEDKTSKLEDKVDGNFLKQNDIERSITVLQTKEKTFGSFFAGILGLIGGILAAAASKLLDL